MNLNGEWIGLYKGHFDEVIRITQNGNEITATKITGDTFVPAGEVTWNADIISGKGEGQIAEEEFRNPHFVPGQLKIHSPEKIEFFWEGHGSVEYRKDD